ncbi:hypothetical protein K08M3_14210 [Vibrio alginolyticus]|uniref:Uncharacterized protein n=1 Tax=Vibrio alginolyticus TaxID=663 RepID=A0A1W6TBX6_VIBAL|nr:hypothetical protein K04M1_14300 [Vibrio alginolyticus]ARP08136.1 hypothetical protein K04M3_14330 [Vibrio alginolyticus]ARP13198.1 hypothetical protein K04M5_13980 [Vibrio alginolyticus]ARP18258.1 hypothetical protein K05K4_14220 [Vibrio alginolyticus]ARP23362.1 hypothetical protein K06K5_14310 [Vibrio alginolyticus]
MADSNRNEYSYRIHLSVFLDSSQMNTKSPVFLRGLSLIGKKSFK